MSSKRNLQPKQQKKVTFTQNVETIENLVPQVVCTSVTNDERTKINVNINPAIDNKKIEFKFAFPEINFNQFDSMLDLWRVILEDEVCVELIIISLIFLSQFIPVIIMLKILKENCRTPCFRKSNNIHSS